MRVFYEYEEEISKIQKRRYYVRVDNVSLPDNLKAYKALEASTTEELKEQIMEYYGFNKNDKLSIELWSNRNRQGKRLDELKEITEENEFIWVRVVSK
jgi:hypothetical protein